MNRGHFAVAVGVANQRQRIRRYDVWRDNPFAFEMLEDDLFASPPLAADKSLVA
jgi:hypothetical protein